MDDAARDRLPAPAARRGQPLPARTERPAARTPAARLARRELVDRETAAEPWPATPEAPAEPTIQVTIGRVEIRATPQGEVRPARAEVRTPALGLDEYLRRRATGGLP
jgi:hypothetical protein